MRPTRYFSLASALAAVVAVLSLAPAARAQEVVGYEIEGYQLSVEGGEILKRADADLRRGLAAVERSDWPAARRGCEAALSGYHAIQLPDIGRIHDWYRAANGCVADSYAMTGDMDEACDRYRYNGWHSLTLRDVRGTCEEREAAEEAAYQSFSDYAALFADFSALTGRLQTLPEGGAERAQVAGRIATACEGLAGYRSSVAGAAPSAGYCRGIVQFEAGRTADACATLSQASAAAAGASRSGLTPEQDRHLTAIGQTLGQFRSVCSSFGHPWP